MNYKYGLKVNGMLVAKYNTPEETYEAGKYAYEETGIFHEVVLVYA